MSGRPKKNVNDVTGSFDNSPSGSIETKLSGSFENIQLMNSKETEKPILEEFKKTELKDFNKVKSYLKMELINIYNDLKYVPSMDAYKKHDLFIRIDNLSNYVENNL